MGNIRFDTQISNLFCAECNAWWGKLENVTGRQLYGFVHGRGRLTAEPARRWALFFAAKILWFYRNTGRLKEGPLAEFFQSLRDPTIEVPSPVRLGLVGSSPRTWQWSALASNDFAFWSFWGVLFFILRMGGELPFRTVELGEGLSRSQLPLVRTSELLRLSEFSDIAERFH